MILQRSQELSKVTGHRGKDAVRAFFRTFQKVKSAPTTAPFCVKRRRIRLLELSLLTTRRKPTGNPNSR
jgi:hypothetical protein